MVHNIKICPIFELSQMRQAIRSRYTNATLIDISRSYKGQVNCRKNPLSIYHLTRFENRYGMTTHLVFTVFGLMTNILVTAMLLTGGSAAFNALTGK